MNGKYIHLGTSRDSLVEALGQIVCSSVTLGEGERKVWFIISKLQHHFILDSVGSTWGMPLVKL